MTALATGLVWLACLGVTLPPYDVTQTQWEDGLVRLAAMRATFPTQPNTRSVTVSFFEPRSRRRFEGRGAVGVDPGKAMRMILIGPAGEPALDVLVTRDHWRMVVPAIGMKRSGGAESPPGLPIGFFRAWFVAPLGGRPLALGRNGELIVRDVAGGTLSIAPTADGAHVARRDGPRSEELTYARSPSGERAHYVDHTTRLEIDVTTDLPQAQPPDPAAFVDPGP
jgi:hypothetical protein